MKKTIFITFLFALSLLQKGYTQNSISIVIGESAIHTDGKCGGSGRGCAQSLQLASTQRNATEENTGTVFLSLDRLNLKFFKNTMSETIKKSDFQGKNIYYIEKDTNLELDFCKSLDRESIKIKQGMYPIIEWEDSYFISLQIETK